MKALLFKNFSLEDFTWSYDSIPYTFKAGQDMYLEDYKAHHFANHLVDRELNLKGIPTNNRAERSKLLAQALPAEAPIPAEEVLDKNIKAEKKDKKDKKVKKEEEFADLQK